MIVISGGQTGIDQIALEVAADLGIQTGGYMPKGWLTEDGGRPDLAQKYGLRETNSPNYPVRTEYNVKNSDLTVILNNAMGPGSRLTMRLCKKHNKPCLINPSPEQVKVLLLLKADTVINFAGTRGSRLSQTIDIFRDKICKILTI